MNNTTESLRFKVSVDTTDALSSLKALTQDIINSGEIARKEVAQVSKALIDALESATSSAEAGFFESLVAATFSIEQSGIDALKDGLGKQMAQLELDFNKQIFEIDMAAGKYQQAIADAQKVEFIEDGGKEEDFVFNPDTEKAIQAFSRMEQYLATSYEKIKQQRIAGSTQIIEAAKSKGQKDIEAYKAIEDQVTAIKQKAVDDRQLIAQQALRGELASHEAILALSKVDASESDDLSQLESSRDMILESWVGTFDTFANYRRGDMRKMIRDINDDIANSKISPLDGAAVIESLKELKDKISANNPFSKITQGFKDRNKARKDVASAREGVTNAAGDSSADKDAAQKTLNEALAVQSKTKEDSSKSFQSSVKDMTGVAGATIGLMKAVGLNDDTGVLGTIGGVVSGLGEFASIDFKNPVSIVTGSIKALSTILASGDAIHDATIIRSQKAIDKLKNKYAELGKDISKSYSTDASNMIGDQNENLEMQKKLVNEQIKAESSKKNKDDAKLKQYRDTLKQLDDQIAENKDKQLDAIMGGDIKSAINSFASAYLDAWSAGEDRAASQKDIVKKMIKDIIREMLKADIADKVKAMREKIQGFIDDDGNLDDSEIAAINSMGEDVAAEMEKRAELYNNLFGNGSSIGGGSLTGEIRGTVATEQSVAELGGIFRGQWDTLVRIENLVGNIKSPYGAQASDIAKINASIELNTLLTSQNTTNMQTELKSINSKINTLIHNTRPDNGIYSYA